MLGGGCAPTPTPRSPAPPSLPAVFLCFFRSACSPLVSIRCFLPLLIIIIYHVWGVVSFLRAPQVCFVQALVIHVDSTSETVFNSHYSTPAADFFDEF